MKLIDQHTKKIMEGCKARAREAGLRFENNTLEYILNVRNFRELLPKTSVPTMYDYWVHDVEVLQEKGKYDMYPYNPYLETVINSRPAISFYNDNNPDWRNVLLFYHVLAHVDFFQNNAAFRHTWDDDFVSRALVDKRLIANQRSANGRWVDYVIEFTRGIDNLVGYHKELSAIERPKSSSSKRVDYYFDIFLQQVKNASQGEYLKDLEKYNEASPSPELRESMFLSYVKTKYPEFESLFEKYSKDKKPKPADLTKHIMENSGFLNKEENTWMKSVVQAVHDTSMYFQPQIRTKIFNEGWASYWHEKLFMNDERIKGNEVNFALDNAGVTAIQRIGINPYAIGLRLLQHIEETADKGKASYQFQQLRSAEQRKKYDTQQKKGLEYLFELRKTMDDFNLINTFVDQDFVDRFNLFVVGRRLNISSEGSLVWEYYVKSRKAEDYKAMLIDKLYHPPHITIEEPGSQGELRLAHQFEGKQLMKSFIPNTLIGIEYLWGAPVSLETTEIVAKTGKGPRPHQKIWIMEDEGMELENRRVIYTSKDRKVSKEIV